MEQAIKKISEIVKTILGFRTIKEFLIAPPNLDSVDAYINRHFFYNDTGHFHPHYNEWTTKRITKILEIYGTNWKEKKILELGSGLGNIGSFFAHLGAKVLALEGRKNNVNFANLRFRNLKNFESVFCDLGGDFTSYGKFDLIINFGLIEVMDNIDNLNNVLKCCAKMSDNILIETLVCDSTDPSKIIYFERDTKLNDESLSHQWVRVSPFYIEKFFKENNFEMFRHFTEDLNTEKHHYNWKHKNDGSINQSMRRFWDFRRIKS